MDFIFVFLRALTIEDVAVALYALGCLVSFTVFMRKTDSGFADLFAYPAWGLLAAGVTAFSWVGLFIARMVEISLKGLR